MSILDRVKKLMNKKQLILTAEDQKVMSHEVSEFIKNAGMKSKTVAVLEPHPWHGEVYPAFIKYFLDLGYDVHLLVDAQHTGLNSLVNCNFPSDRFKMFEFAHFPIKQEFYDFLVNYEYLFLMTVLTHDGFHYALSLERNFLQKYNKNNLYCISHELSSLNNRTETFESRMVDKNRVFVLRDKIKYKEKELPFVSPVYFGDIKITSKNKKTKFISIGGVWKKGLRNFDNLFNTMKKLHENNIRNFEIIFVGVDKVSLEAYITPEIQPYITLIGRVPYNQLFNCVEDADFILFNSDPTTKDFDKYMHYGITGNYMHTLAFQTPGLIYEELGNEYLLDNTRAIHYTNDLYDAMKKAIEISPEQYEQMQNNLGELKETLMAESFKNMKQAFGEVLVKC
ncbi:MAG: hypothetical protein LBK53_03615 [Heliobacteriaceae bacterium]|jgi:hypothetical protein|nr:hypothetical protein [Heliobacteriaceae bacterium]